MSDYLGNLAARSLDPAGIALRPRLASRFEPIAPSPSLAVERWAEEPPTLETAAEEIDSPARPVRAARPRIVSSETVVEEEPAPVRRRRPRRNLEEVAQEPLSETARPRDVRLAVSAPATATAVSPLGLPARRSVSPFEPSPPGPLSRGERGNAIPTGFAHPDRLQLVTVREPALRQDAPELSPLSPRAPRETGSGSKGSKAIPPAPPTRVVLEPRLTLAPPAPPPVFPASPRASEAPAPTIQVTIGRIEVRATPPPAEASRPRPAANSTLSLEEYLRRRSQGGDR